MAREIFIMAEQTKGIVDEVSLCLLAEGKRINEQMGNSHTLSAVVLGHNLQSLEREFGRHGADKVYYFEDRRLDRYQPEIYMERITRLIREKEPEIFLLAATSVGSDLAPRIAARLKVGLVTRCVDIIVDAHRLAVVKPVADQFLYRRIAFAEKSPRMMTFSLDALTKGEPNYLGTAEVIRMDPQPDQRPGSLRFLELIKADPKTIGLKEADVIVCAGRGVGKGGFELVHSLADALNGSIGGTRPVIDWGILPYERQIGQTGVEVSPSLLIAVGVSGANEFTAGIGGSKLIVAINTDRRARIFKYADLGIVGDLHKVMPLLIERVKASRSLLKDGRLTFSG